MDRKQYIETNTGSMIRDLNTLVSIDSVWDPDTVRAGSPFGTAPKRALTQFLLLAEEMGFITRDFDGYAGDVTAGDGSKMVGILGHLDVVAAGEGWNTDPFTVIEKEDGNLYGRGTSDDKGPLVSCLYAMKYLQDNGLIPKDHCIRLIVGCDEEENMQCIQYYTTHAERLPDYTMIPDAYFPLVNSEKGLVDFDSEFHFEPESGADAVMTEFAGGSARNIVPGKAHCRIAVQPDKKDHVLGLLSAVPGLIIEETPDGCIARTEGVSTHAMAPENGKNATSLLLCGLKTSGIKFSSQPFIDVYTENIGMEFNGEHLDCCWSDGISGVLTVNFGLIELKNNIFNMKANVRYPVSYTHAELLSHFTAHLEGMGFTYHENLSMEPMFIDKDTPFIHSLMDAYREVTGDLEHEPFSLGGATYARFLPNAVSFGPLFPYETELAHEANECISIESFRKFTEIYILALEKMLDL